MAKKNTIVEDDPYETPTFAHSREMDQLVVANTINNKVEKEDISGLDDKEEKWRAKDNTLMKYHNKFGQKKGKTNNIKIWNGRGSEKTNDTKVKNGFKQCQQHTKENWSCSLCPT